MRQNAFTLIEMLIVLAIVAVLTAILLPVLSKVRENGRSTSCRSNLRQIGMAIQMYEGDYNKTPVAWNGKEMDSPLGEPWPWGEGVEWTERIAPYLQSSQVFHCPSDQHFGQFNQTSDYSFNLATTNTQLSSFSRPSKLIMLLDDYPTFHCNYVFPADYRDKDTAEYGTRHLERRNAVFVDGHVKSILADQVESYPPPPLPENLPYAMHP